MIRKRLDGHTDEADQTDLRRFFFKMLKRTLYIRCYFVILRGTKEPLASGLPILSHKSQSTNGVACVGLSTDNLLFERSLTSTATFRGNIGIFSI